jgi:undecaprenyl-diphosphatase
MDSILHFDQQLFLYLNQLGSPSFDFFWLLLTHKATNVVVYLVLAIVYGRTYGWRSSVYLIVWVIILIAFTDQITNAFKYGFGRLRPCHEPGVRELMRLVKDSCGGQFSFFSGHASNSFALATLFFLSFRKIIGRGRILLFVLAALIAYSRVYIGVHYPIDILCGALFGLLAGSLFWRLGLRFRIIQ